MPSRLVRFEVTGLFGLYHHKITLKRDERITIVIGPNGLGKTVCLKLIEAFFLQNFEYFLEIPFEKISFHFENGTQFSVIKVAKRAEPNSADDSLQLELPTLPTFRQGSEKHAEVGLQFEMVAPGSEAPTRIEIGGIDSRATAELRRFAPPTWEMVSRNLWVDQADGEELTFDQFIDRHNIPTKLANSLRPQIPQDVIDLISPIDCHLIETQRLLVLPKDRSDDEFGFVPPHRRRHGRASGLAIQQKAERLKSILKDKLTVYANTSQSLDRNFPLRVFEAQGTATLSQDLLRSALRQLDERRAALMKAGILDSDIRPVTMRPGNIESGVAMALEIYVKDATEKLDLFNDLRARIDLFKQLIESRFLDKTIQIDRASGFKIFSKTGRQVPLDRLSSGEQHQLILIFDLLFEVSPNSLILIDEPELSLHVAWQKSFIDSLTQMIELNKFDVILATHSPAVLARHFNLSVELGSVE